jgi:hypothetical protein
VGSRRLEVVDVAFAIEVVCTVEMRLDSVEVVFDGGSIMIANVLIDVTVVAPPLLATVSRLLVTVSRDEVV